MTRTTAFLLLAAAACGGGAASSGVSSAPAPAPERTARETVLEFMQAVADSNLRRMAELWGTERERASASATGVPSDFGQRVMIMQAYLRNGGHRVIADLEGQRGRRIITLELDRPGCKKQVPFTLIRARNGEWMISAVDLDAAGNPLKPCGSGSLH